MDNWLSNAQGDRGVASLTAYRVDGLTTTELTNRAALLLSDEGSLIDLEQVG